MKENVSDADAIEASKTDPEAFRLIFERHHAAVFRFTARRVGRETARDLAADIFVRAFTKRHDYNTDRPNALPWLYGIAVNVIGDHLRKRTRRGLAHLPLRRAPDPTSRSDDRLVATSVSRDLKRALAKLSESDRQTFVLYALEDLSYTEIAEALGIPVGTVGSRVFRARRKIRKHIPDLEERIGIMSQTNHLDNDE